LKLGQARDHAGWGPLQEEQEGSFAGHLFGGWLLGAFGADGFIGAFGLTVAELETPGALQKCGGGWV
jgi:hypothetical protein